MNAPRAAFWISITFFPISRRMSWRHLSASFRSLHSDARYGRFFLGPLRASVFPERKRLSMDCGRDRVQVSSGKA